MLRGGVWNLEFGIWNLEFGIWSLKKIRTRINDLGFLKFKKNEDQIRHNEF